jgi:hypothetical protein
MGVLSSDVGRGDLRSPRTTLIHNILWTAPQLSISQEAPGTLPEDGNVMPKHVGNTIHIDKLVWFFTHILTK